MNNILLRTRLLTLMWLVATCPWASASVKLNRFWKFTSTDQRLPRQLHYRQRISNYGKLDDGVVSVLPLLSISFVSFHGKNSDLEINPLLSSVPSSDHFSRAKRQSLPLEKHITSITLRMIPMVSKSTSSSTVPYTYILVCMSVESPGRNPHSLSWR